MFLDLFRTRLHNPQTGERWIHRPSPVDVFLGYAAVAGAILFFVLVSHAIVAHAPKKAPASATKPQRGPVPQTNPIHPQPKSIAQHNAEMFQGTQQALDQLGQFPAEPAKTSTKEGKNQ